MKVSSRHQPCLTHVQLPHTAQLTGSLFIHALDWLSQAVEGDRGGRSRVDTKFGTARRSTLCRQHFHCRSPTPTDADLHECFNVDRRLRMWAEDCRHRHIGSSQLSTTQPQLTDRGCSGQSILGSRGRSSQSIFSGILGVVWGRLCMSSQNQADTPPAASWQKCTRV